MVEHQIILFFEDQGKLFPKLMTLIVIAGQQNSKYLLKNGLKLSLLIVGPDLDQRLVDIVFDYLGSHRGVDVLFYLAVAAVVVDVGEELEVETCLVDYVLEIADSYDREGLFVEAIAEGLEPLLDLEGQLPQLPGFPFAVF